MNWGKLVASPGLAMSWKNKKSTNTNPIIIVKLSIFFIERIYYIPLMKKSPNFRALSLLFGVKLNEFVGCRTEYCYW